MSDDEPKNNVEGFCERGHRFVGTRCWHHTQECAKGAHPVTERKLLPCPFHEDKGYEVELLADRAIHARFSVRCGYCEARGPSGSSEQSAIGGWNRRAAPVTERKQVLSDDDIYAYYGSAFTHLAGLRAVKAAVAERYEAQLAEHEAWIDKIMNALRDESVTSHHEMPGWLATQRRRAEEAEARAERLIEHIASESHAIGLSETMTPEERISAMRERAERLAAALEGITEDLAAELTEAGSVMVEVARACIAAGRKALADEGSPPVCTCDRDVYLPGGAQGASMPPCPLHGAVGDRG